MLLLSGEHDPKFTGIARRMAEHIGPNATATVVEGAGHSAHLEQPERTTRCVRTWLEDPRTEPALNPVPDRTPIGNGPIG